MAGGGGGGKGGAFCLEMPKAGSSVSPCGSTANGFGCNQSIWGRLERSARTVQLFGRLVAPRTCSKHLLWDTIVPTTTQSWLQKWCFFFLKDGGGGL